MSVPVPPPDSPFWKNPQLCTYDTCPLKGFAQLNYRPNFSGNVISLSLFGLGLVVQIGQAIRYRTWGYLAAICGGCVLEVIGYAGRLLLWNNDFNKNYFIIYLIGCTIGPAFYSAAIYLSISRIILVYGRSASRLDPRKMTICFIAGDFLSLLLQAIGGALASTGKTDHQVNLGVWIMIAGLSSQVASCTVFTVLCGLMRIFISRREYLVNQRTTNLQKSPRFKFFLFAIGASTLLILVRCCFRVAELSKGFKSSLANNEVMFMVLDGLAMSLVVILLTLAHPGMVFGQELWEAGAFKNLRKDNRNSQASLLPKKTFTHDYEMLHEMWK